MMQLSKSRRLTGRRLIVAAMTGMVALAGCSGSATDATTPVPDTTTSASATAASSQGCTVADVTGQSKNQELQAFAMAQYDALDCTGDLGQQLREISKDAAFQQAAKTAGYDTTTGEAMGGVTLNIVDVKSRTGCIITVMDATSSKMLNCGDL